MTEGVPATLFWAANAWRVSKEKSADALFPFSPSKARGLKAKTPDTA